MKFRVSSIEEERCVYDYLESIGYDVFKNISHYWYEYELSYDRFVYVYSNGDVFVNNSEYAFNICKNKEFKIETIYKLIEIN